MAIHWDISECLAAPSFHCLKLELALEEICHPSIKNPRWRSTKNLHARNGKIKFTNHEFKMFMFKFPGCFRTCHFSSMCQQPSLHWGSKILDLCHLPICGFIPTANHTTKNSWKNMGISFPSKSLKPGPMQKSRNRVVTNFASQSPPLRRHSLWGFKLCWLGFPGVIGKTKGGRRNSGKQGRGDDSKICTSFKAPRKTSYKWGETGPL